MSSLIEASGITKRFGRTTALKDVSFTITDGESVGLVGPNGAGKSTLMSILCGYLQPSEGKLTIQGTQPGTPESLGLVGALPQDALLHPSESVGEQLAFFARLQGFGKREAEREARRVIGLVRLEDRFTSKPQSLSHGMTKRISIAQAMIGNPKLIVLDEPTAGLDPETARHFRRLLQELRNETTLLVSSHNLDELENLCERTLFLTEGVLKDIGPETMSGRAYLTLEVAGQNLMEVGQALRSIGSVCQVHQRGQHTLLIEYEPDMKSHVDIEVLQLLKAHKWSYRSLIFGRTLEDQLFGDQEQ